MEQGPPGTSVPEISQARTLEHCHFPLQIFPTQGVNPSPALHIDSLLTELQGKPPCDPEITVLDIYPEEIKYYAHTK